MGGIVKRLFVWNPYLIPYTLRAYFSVNISVDAEILCRRIKHFRVRRLFLQLLYHTSLIKLKGFFSISTEIQEIKGVGDGWK